MNNKIKILLNNLIKYYNSLSILKKFFIPSLIGFIFSLFFYIYILSNTTNMKQSIKKINTQSIPVYETIFDNEFLLQKISYELHSSVVADEIDWINETEIYALTFRKNLKVLEKSTFKNELNEIQRVFNTYYKEASDLSRQLIISKKDYDDIHNKTILVVNKYNKLLQLLQDLRNKLKINIKKDINFIYSTSSMILLDSSYTFILWMFISFFILLYIYKDMSSRIKQIVFQSENIASGKANFHKRLSSISSDELGLIVKSINTFISKLEKNHHELEDTRDDIQRFIADTVHQIRTPLSSILINAEMIRDLQKDQSFSDCIDSIDASINMLSNSYEDLSYVTSYDSIQYNPCKISLTNLVNTRIDFFKTICKMNLKEIQANIHDELNIFINIFECERIIDNNISNAIKYANVEKPISINLSRIDKTNKIMLEFKSFAKEIKNKNKIFEKNYREEESKRGLGIGLNIVRNICDKYHITYNVKYKNEQNIFTYIFEEI